MRREKNSSWEGQPHICYSSSACQVTSGVCKLLYVHFFFPPQTLFIESDEEFEPPPPSYGQGLNSRRKSVFGESYDPDSENKVTEKVYHLVFSFMMCAALLVVCRHINIEKGCAIYM